MSSFPVWNQLVVRGKNTHTHTHTGKHEQTKKKRTPSKVPLDSSRIGDPITSQKAEKTRVGLEFDPNDDNAFEAKVNRKSLYVKSEAYASRMTEGHVPTPLIAVVKGTSGSKVTKVFLRYLDQMNSSSAT